MNPYYEDSAVTIYHGDCREILPILPKVDLVLTDPPYGVGKDYGSSSDDIPETFAWASKMVAETLLPSAVLSSVSNMRFAPDPDWTGVFRKTYGAMAMFSMPFYPHWEAILFYNLKGYYFGNKGHRSDVFECLPETASKIGHITPKPLGLMSQLIEFMPAKGTILDPFMGSGTTLRAAKDLGRKAIGIEIEEKYCEIAAKRMAQEVLEFKEQPCQR